MRSEFISAVQSNQTAFGLTLSDGSITRLADYYELIQEHNPILHLVGPCSPEEFAIRHILESLTLLEHLPKSAKLIDVGPGAGLPSVPCLLVRDDIRGLLIESKVKKIGFLQMVLEKFEFGDRVEILSNQFSETPRPSFSYVTCRALDKFTQKLPQMVKWSGSCRLLFFGGNSLRDGLKANGVKFHEKLMPMSEQRFLFYTSLTA